MIGIGLAGTLLDHADVGTHGQHDLLL
jgi:hypothetical protein